MEKEIHFQNFVKALAFGIKIFNPFVSVGTKREFTRLWEDWYRTKYSESCNLNHFTGTKYCCLSIWAFCSLSMRSPRKSQVNWASANSRNMFVCLVRSWRNYFKMIYDETFLFMKSLWRNQFPTWRWWYGVRRVGKLWLIKLSHIGKFWNTKKN